MIFVGTSRWASKSWDPLGFIVRLLRLQISLALCNSSNYVVPLGNVDVDPQFLAAYLRGSSELRALVESKAKEEEVELEVKDNVELEEPVKAEEPVEVEEPKENEIAEEAAHEV